MVLIRDFGLEVRYVDLENRDSPTYEPLPPSVFVGVAVMLIMISVPGMIAKRYHDVQVTKMKKVGFFGVSG